MVYGMILSLIDPDKKFSHNFSISLFIPIDIE